MRLPLGGSCWLPLILIAWSDAFPAAFYPSSSHSQDLLKLKWIVSVETHVSQETLREELEKSIAWNSSTGGTSCPGKSWVSIVSWLARLASALFNLWKSPVRSIVIDSGITRFYHCRLLIRSPVYIVSHRPYADGKGWRFSPECEYLRMRRLLEAVNHSIGGVGKVSLQRS